MAGVGSEFSLNTLNNEHSIHFMLQKDVMKMRKDMYDELKNHEVKFW
jgi:hypothetical protein